MSTGDGEPEAHLGPVRGDGRWNPVECTDHVLSRQLVLLQCNCVVVLEVSGVWVDSFPAS